jgi:hypothetical protein
MRNGHKYGADDKKYPFKGGLFTSPEAVAPHGRDSPLETLRVLVSSVASGSPLSRPPAPSLEGGGRGCKVDKRM